MFIYFLFFAGLTINFALTRLSSRQVGIVGSLIFFIGSFWSTFCKSTLELVFAFGVLQGSGMGLMFPSCYATLNGYFIKKRTFVIGIMQLGVGVGCMFIPKLIQCIFDEYGLFGTQLIISAFSLHALLSAIMQKPATSRKSKKTEEFPMLEQISTKDKMAEIRVAELALKDEDNCNNQEKRDERRSKILDM